MNSNFREISSYSKYVKPLLSSPNNNKCHQLHCIGWIIIAITPTKHCKYVYLHHHCISVFLIKSSNWHLYFFHLLHKYPLNILLRHSIIFIRNVFSGYSWWWNGRPLVSNFLQGINGIGYFFSIILERNVYHKYCLC